MKTKPAVLAALIAVAIGVLAGYAKAYDHLVRCAPGAKAAAPGKAAKI